MNIPSKSNDENIVKLYSWVTKQKRMITKGELSDEKISKLKDLNIIK